MKMRTRNITLCALFTAVMCVLCVITIPIGPVPITLGTLGIMLTAVILGHKRGTASVLAYILLGAVGLPVFSGFKGGFQVLIGPTGGYIWSYIIMAFLIGFASRTLPKNKWTAMLKIFIACIAGIAVCYALGTVQFMFVQKTNLTQSLMMCVAPFIPFDAVKAVVAVYLGYTVRKALEKAGLA